MVICCYRVEAMTAILVTCYRSLRDTKNPSSFGLCFFFFFSPNITLPTFATNNLKLGYLF
jgi:hypothetical protein